MQIEDIEREGPGVIKRLPEALNKAVARNAVPDDLERDVLALANWIEPQARVCFSIRWDQVLVCGCAQLFGLRWPWLHVSLLGDCSHLPFQSHRSSCRGACVRCLPLATAAC